MANQNSAVDGSAVVSTISTNPKQSMKHGQGGQQQPMWNPGPFILTPIIHHDKPKERTKWVAVIDMSFGIIWLLVVLQFIFQVLQILLQINVQARSADSSRRFDPTFINFLIAFFLIATILAGFESITAYGLLKATRRGTAPKIAYRKAKFWRGWSFLFLFFNFNYGYLCIASGVRLESYSMISIGIGYIVCFFIRLFFICVVNGYILELEKGAFVIPASTIASMEITNSINQQQQP